jgi:hypothetical protein
MMSTARPAKLCQAEGIITVETVERPAHDDDVQCLDGGASKQAFRLQVLD